MDSWQRGRYFSSLKAGMIMENDGKSELIASFGFFVFFSLDNCKEFDAVYRVSCPV